MTAPEPVRHHDVRRFGLLASAIAGRLVAVESLEPGALAWTDGTTIFVDPDAPASGPLQCIAVQAALLGAGSLGPDTLDRLARSTSLARRYLLVEGHRALGALEPALPRAVRRLTDHDLVALSGSPAESLALASSRHALGEPPRTFGVIRARRVQRTSVTTGPDPASGPHRPRAQGREVLRELDDDVEDPFEGPDLVSSPVGGGGAIGRLLKGLFRNMRSSTGGPPGADAATHWSRHGAGTSPHRAVTPATLPETDAGRTLSRFGLTYPEWDVHRGRYRPDWCTVTPVDLEPAATGILPWPDVHGVRRPLAQIGVALERRHRQLQGIDVDLDAAVDAHVQTIAGSVPDEAVYVDLIRARRDLGVLVLLDVSGSSGEQSAVGGTVHEQQRKAAAALTVALAALGDRVALYAFRSQGRSAVQVERVKRFDDHMNTAVLGRLAASKPGAYTRLGAAIRHGTAILAQESGVSRRLLVVLSDGFAYDHGYEGTYGEADARRTLSEARRSGTGCVCLSIGASTDAATLRRVFGTAAHAGVARFEDLPRVLAPLFRFALRSAEAQRRVSQHTVRARERLALERRSVA